MPTVCRVQHKVCFKFAFLLALKSALHKYLEKNRLNLFFIKASKRSISQLSRLVCLIYTIPAGEFAEGKAAVREGEHFLTNPHRTGGQDRNLSLSVSGQRAQKVLEKLYTRNYLLIIKHFKPISEQTAMRKKQRTQSIRLMFHTADSQGINKVNTETSLPCLILITLSIFTQAMEYAPLCWRGV